MRTTAPADRHQGTNGTTTGPFEPLGPFRPFRPFGPEAEAAVKAADRDHVFHPWAAQDLVDPLAVAGAEGPYFWDYAGHRYLDFGSGLVHTNIGYQHPKVVAAIQEQAARLAAFPPSFAVDVRSEAARLIAERTPGDLDRIFFTTGGAEAVENAVRMARLHTGRTKVLSAYRSYHGATSTAINLTGDPRRWPSDTASAGVVHFWTPFLYRSPFYAATEAEECARALQHLQDTIAFEGPATIAAIVLETVPGTAGIMPPPPGYLAGVREICDRYGIVLVLDEVMAGFGRTGAWFAAEHYGVVPDLLTFAKGVNSGYVPLGGVAVSAEIAATFARRPYPGGLTYSGHPLACAAAVATIRVMEEEKVVEQAAALGENVLGPGLRELAARHPSVGEVRGLGAFWAVELVRDRATREPLVPYNATGAAAAPMAAFGAACREHGLWPFLAMNRTHVAPACNLSGARAEEGLAALDAALTVADTYTANTTYGGTHGTHGTHGTPYDLPHTGTPATVPPHLTETR
ncbi:aspartate aminotransferase family protein [Streptomyces sp. WAC06614]|uniref:aspartate aminotransferase family protein n=1 Tax=Streptomyces sp. WAC06614 TaxID=2487416 RepID=UPI000F79D3FE|nr:aspartate aminotransferase family protein [Streptomyces sp. WAC06614]RSS80796.1 aspartate aminotransferase family protein [Streptomyces sp. WAC06614]